MKVKKICYSAVLGSLMIGIFIMPQMAMAAEGCNTGNILPACVCDGNCNLDDFVIGFVNLATFFLGIVAIFALYYFVNGAFTLVVSAGSPEKIAAGKGTLVNSLVGLFVVLSAWVIINTLFSLFTGSDTVFGQQWWKFKTAPALPKAEEQVQVPTGGAEVGTINCSDLRATAAGYNVPFEAREAPSLVELRSCIESNVPPEMIDQSQIYTIDRNHPSCNYTRGDPQCEPKKPEYPEHECSHSRYSCHYGGASGSEGALGVDYNAAAGYTESQLNDKIHEAIDSGGACHSLVEGYVDHSDHTHLSAIGCRGE